MTDTTNETESTANPTPSGARTEPRLSPRRALLISAGAVLAAAVLVGGGVAVGAAIADENDDDRDTTSDTAEREDDTATDADDSRTDAAGTASASELLDIIDIASAEAEGEPVGIEATSAGSWEVQFSTAEGEESEVRVARDGTAAVVSTEAADQDDQAREGTLDAQTVEALVTAALAHTDGTVVDIEIDSDTASPYDVSVLTADRKTVDLALDPEFAVLTADASDD